MNKETLIRLGQIGDSATQVVLEGLHLTQADLAAMSFDEVRFSNCHFVEVDFSECDVQACSFEHVIFERCDWQGAIWNETHFTACRFLDCTLQTLTSQKNIFTQVR